MRLLNVVPFIAAALVLASPTRRSTAVTSKATEPDPKFAVSVKVDSVTYVNKGLVAFGVIPSDFKESTGDTIGGIGSAIALKRGSFKNNSNGTFSGTFVVQPDRGFNIDGTIDYQSRQHNIDFLLSPYYDDADLTFAEGLTTLQLTYKSTILNTERNKVATSGLDPAAVRAATSGFPSNPLADPQFPIASTSLPHLTIDAEGLVLNADGTIWMSDEYGPYIHHFDASGNLIQTIQPPQAILPTINGVVNFTANEDPDTGRAANQGFEGLTVDSTGNTLYALLQTATIQDGGDDKSSSRFTRLLAWDISSASTVRPPLVGEWIVPLPQNSKGNTLGASELHFISPNIFFALSRDGNGHGDDDDSSSYKQADLVDITKATNIAGTKFDSSSNPVAPKGKLDKSVTAATYTGFVNFIDDDQLARLGIHNGDPDDETNIDAKWESLALAPVGDAAFPNDFFLFTASDNDFLSTHGVSLGQPFDAGIDVDNQFMVFRVTLPGAAVVI